MKKTQPLTLDIGLNGGVGGYDSKADPDRNLDSYYKVKDNNMGGNVRLDWLLNKSWITNLNLQLPSPTLINDQKATAMRVVVLHNLIYTP